MSNGKKLYQTPFFKAVFECVDMITASGQSEKTVEDLEWGL